MTKFDVAKVQKYRKNAFRLLHTADIIMLLLLLLVDWCTVYSVYDAYSFHVIPVMGQLIAADWKSYQYLVESIRQFPGQVTVVRRVAHG